MTSLPSLPAPILRNSPKTYTLGYILDSYDPDIYEQATSLFRKPSYQRVLKKSPLWCKDLVDSILSGKSMGAIHLSKWVHSFLDEDGHPLLEEYYNMEDGQTRMDACLRFRAGEFESTWGPYTDPDIAMRFNCYQVPSVLIEKAHNRIKDSIYFKELNQNFCDLQESTALTASDRYLSQQASPDHKFVGAPLVNITMEVASTFSEELKMYCNIRSLDRDSLSKNLAYLVALVSGSLDLTLANTSYYTHVPTLFDTLSDDKKRAICMRLKEVFGAIQLALDIKPRVKSEHIVNYSRLPGFMGPMFADRHTYPDESPETFMRRWAMCINDSRKAKENGDKEWLRNTIYKGLGDGVLRNCKKEDFESKMIAVRTHYQNLL